MAFDFLSIFSENFKYRTKELQVPLAKPNFGNLIYTFTKPLSPTKPPQHSIQPDSSSFHQMSKPGAIITGAASGVGLALTKHLSKGWRVVMTDIRSSGSAVAAELGPDVVFVKSDVGNWESQVVLFETGMSTIQSEI